MAELTDVINNSMTPTYVNKPDMRFATTFISNKYRDYAVKGESIMDKATGEIFTKRPADGRVVSFFQNKKYMHDLMLELRVLLNNNVSFRYPNEDNTSAYYLSTDYDMMSIFSERDVNIVRNDMIIPNSVDSDVDNLRFKVSTKSNGFFCRLTSRDSDKAIIEWLTSQYNTIVKDYVGNDRVFIEEGKKFKNIEKWEDSNACISYEVTLVTDNGTTRYNFTDYVRINEETCVLFPDALTESMLEECISVYVKIKSITYDKIHFMIENKLLMNINIIEGINKFIYPDNAIYIRYCNIGSFVDDSTDIILLGNEFIIAMLDVPYIRRYMMKMSMLANGSSMVLSPNRPSNDIWLTNGMWAEQVRNVYQGGKKVNLDCEIDLTKLENYLSDTSDVVDYVRISNNPDDLDSIYFKEV